VAKEAMVALRANLADGAETIEEARRALARTSVPAFRLFKRRRALAMLFDPAELARRVNETDDETRAKAAALAGRRGGGR
jgi:hypothetical protein